MSSNLPSDTSVIALMEILPPTAFFSLGCPTFYKSASMNSRNSSLPSAWRSHEAKQNPRSSHSLPTRPQNSSIYSRSRNRFLPEGNAVATQMGCTYKYQCKGWRASWCQNCSQNEERGLLPRVCPYPTSPLTPLPPSFSSAFYVDPAILN